MKIRPIDWTDYGTSSPTHRGVLSNGNFCFSFIILVPYSHTQGLELFVDVSLTGSSQEETEVIGHGYKTVEEAKLAAVKFVEDFIKGLLEPDSDKE